jgi:hypothetical protein
MMGLRDRARAHLREAGKDYWTHATFAWKAAALLLWAALTSVIHGLVPAWFPFVSRDIVRDLANRGR